MISNKRINAVVAAVVLLSLVLCFCAMFFSDTLTELFGSKITQEYETELFDTDSVITVDILMDESEWNEMLENATSEEYYRCDVKINGTTFYSVGIRPKGNTSLSAIASDPTTERYSFKLEFDQYIEGQTCFGLDKLILNNNYADATNMKEALIYDMYSYLGADASLCNYAAISVNGSYWGVYLALEAVEDSFMLRNYGVASGELYKPDSLNMGGGDGNNIQPDSSALKQFGENMPEGFDLSDIGKNMTEGIDFSQFGGATPPNAQAGEEPDIANGSNDGSSTGGGGANLEYTDDELDSYSTIWEGSVTETTDSDHLKVVTALKNISTGTELEKYLDVDNVLKYMAVHSFAVNEDSLSGSMAHNYYLYEYNGQLNIIPWDYNLSFGGMSAGGTNSASAVINDPIDTPFSGTTFFDVLLENEEYLAKYHEYYRMLVEKYVNGGGFDSFYTEVRDKIDGLIESDPNALYSYSEYENAANMLYRTVMLRAQSVLGQLDGTIPSTEQGQKQDSSSLIDATNINIATMGTFSMGGENKLGTILGRSTEDDASVSEDNNRSESAVSPPFTDDTKTQSPGNSQGFGSFGQGFTPPDTQGANQPEGAEPNTQSEEQSKAPNSTSAVIPTGSNLLWIGVSLVCLLAAIVFASGYRPRARKR